MTTAAIKIAIQVRVILGPDAEQISHLLYHFCR